MKILMTADAAGGVWTYTLELVTELVQRDYEVTIALLGGHLDHDRRRELTETGVQAWSDSDLKLDWMPNPSEDLAKARSWLSELAAAASVDLVHLNSFGHAAIADAAVVQVVHSDVLSWWRAVKGTDAPPAWARYAADVRASLEAADVVVAPTQAVLSSLTAMYGFRGPSAVISNGRDLPRARLTARQELVVTVGRAWDEAKNVAALERVAARIGWPVVVVGEGGSGDAARYVGRVPIASVLDWLRRASIFAEPARYEPFGLAALEAALCGCALVLGDIPSLREVWDDAALFVDPTDDNALEAALQQLIRSTQLREDLAARARARAAGFSRRSMGDAYDRLYRGLVRPQPANLLEAADAR